MMADAGSEVLENRILLQEHNEGENHRRKRARTDPTTKKTSKRERLKRDSEEDLDGRDFSLKQETTSAISLKSLTESMLGTEFVDEYRIALPHLKYLVLLRKFDEIWQNSELRPEKITSIIRNALGVNLAPHNIVGHPSIDIPIGFTCHYKAQLYLLGLHFAPMVGISCLDRTASAVVVNGGYADDVDTGSIFIYVGEGGEQTGENQSLSRGNLGLLEAARAGIPVRVIRGYKAHSRHAPSWGFRYDGLYEVTTAYWDIGIQDRRVWKFVIQSLDQSRIPPICGCAKQGVLKHDTEPDDVRFPPQFVPSIHKKTRDIANKHYKVHRLVQEQKFDGEHKIVSVISPSHNFTLKINQLLVRTSGPGNKGLGMNSPDREYEPKYRLPTFKSFLRALKQGPDAKWTEEILPLIRLSNSDPRKPAWARGGFFPFMLRLTVNKDGEPFVLSLPVSKELGNEHALPYFPKSTKDSIMADIELRPPFDDSFNPLLDVSQGVEDTAIPCINDIDDCPPPTEFTYIKKSITFFGSAIPLVNVCLGCLPRDIDTSQWEDVPGSKDRCPGKIDPSSGRVYCCGENREGLDSTIGDCSEKCPCSILYCDNRRWREGVQYRVAVKRFQDIGWGVVAQERIPRGMFVMEYAGDVIHFGEMKARVHKYETSGFSNFCFEIFRTKEGSNEFWNFPCVDSLYFGNVSRLINHSCDPNLVPIAHYHNQNQGRCLSLFSLRDIDIGEQLTYDYGSCYTEGIECLCKAPNCRGFMRQPENDTSECDGTIIEANGSDYCPPNFSHPNCPPNYHLST